MRDVQQCLAKAEEMQNAAQRCPDALLPLYYKLAVDWNLLARVAEWQLKLEAVTKPPLAGRPG
jgi:hypothetical protein